MQGYNNNKDLTLVINFFLTLKVFMKLISELPTSYRYPRYAIVAIELALVMQTTHAQR